MSTAINQFNESFTYKKEWTDNFQEMKGQKVLYI